MGRLASHGLDVDYARRIRNLICSGGESLGLQEVEDVIEATPGVRRAGLVGVPDERPGEVPWARLESQDGARLGRANVGEWCRGKVADLKIPPRVLVVDALPLGRSGKLERKALAPMARVLVEESGR